MDLIRLIMNRACVLLPHVVLLQYIDGMDGMVQVFKCFMVDLICTTTVLEIYFFTAIGQMLTAFGVGIQY